MAALVALLSPLGVGVGQIMLVCVPRHAHRLLRGRAFRLQSVALSSTRILCTSVVWLPASSRRASLVEKVAFVPKKGAKLSVAIFVLGAVLIVLFGYDPLPCPRPFMVEGRAL